MILTECLELRNLGLAAYEPVHLDEVQSRLVASLAQQLGYSEITEADTRPGVKT